MPTFKAKITRPALLVRSGGNKKKPLCTVGGNINWYSHYVKLYGDCSKN